MLHACPTHHVATGALMYCTVSYMPRPAVTSPPTVQPGDTHEQAGHSTRHPTHLRP